jgi:cytosine permease
MPLPDYLQKAIPNSSTNRSPWYSNTAPSYAGVFLWVVFYQALAQGTIDHAGPLFCVGALVVAGLLSYLLCYYVPAILGMTTGHPLYVVGSSTFGATGGYLMPGLLMGVLQVGWLAVGGFLSTTFILTGLGMDARPMTLRFAIVAILWGYITGYVGVRGIQYVAKVSLVLNAIPLLMILVVFIKMAPGLRVYHPQQIDHFAAFTLILQAVIGFFATAGAAGTDFGMNSRNLRDVKLGGLVGISAAILYAGTLPILSVAGAHAQNPTLPFTYQATIGAVGGFMASAMFLLFAAASVTPACVSSFIAGNSFSTMIPRISRMTSTMLGVTVAVAVAISGYAANLIVVFSIVGASFGPICGAMAADYLLAGRKWAGPRKGFNWAGYIAWAVGFVTGILPLLIPERYAMWRRYAEPAVVYSIVLGFLVYAAAAKMGLESEAVGSELQ